LPFDPYLSVVATARNDDHGGNLLCRLQTFVNALMAQARIHALPVELVLVEWNPPAGRPPLAEAVRWQAGTGPCRVRILTVPPEIHARYRHAEALPLYQMIGKNVGIRRAEGEFILATNIDVLFSIELWEFLAARRLAAGRMYRLDRYDVAADVPTDASPADQLAWCRSHLLRVNARDGTFPVTAEGLPIRPQPAAAPAARAGEYALAGARLLRDWVRGKRAIPPLPDLLHPRREPEVRAAAVHTNACGDFTLVHRRHWHDLRGYPEFDMYSMNIDSVFCYMAHCGGAVEEVLADPMRIYHIEHGSGWTPENHNLLFERLAAKGIPWLEFDEVLGWAAQMERLQTTMVFNHEDWGLATCDLREWKAASSVSEGPIPSGSA
jgi:hypothetical protein